MRDREAHILTSVTFPEYEDRTPYGDNWEFVDSTAELEYTATQDGNGNLTYVLTKDIRVADESTTVENEPIEITLQQRDDSDTEDVSELDAVNLDDLWAVFTIPSTDTGADNKPTGQQDLNDESALVETEDRELTVVESCDDTNETSKTRLRRTLGTAAGSIAAFGLSVGVFTFADMVNDSNASADQAAVEVEINDSTTTTSTTSTLPETNTSTIEPVSFVANQVTTTIELVEDTATEPTTTSTTTTTTSEPTTTTVAETTTTTVTPRHLTLLETVSEGERTLEQLAGNNVGTLQLPGSCLNDIQIAVTNAFDPVHDASHAELVGDWSKYSEFVEPGDIKALREYLNPLYRVERDTTPQKACVIEGSSEYSPRWERPVKGYAATLGEFSTPAEIQPYATIHPMSDVPGTIGGVSIVEGHRTTESSPFSNIDAYLPGQSAQFSDGHNTTDYVFLSHNEVSPDMLIRDILEQYRVNDQNILIISTCEDGSATRLLSVFVAQ